MPHTVQPAIHRFGNGLTVLIREEHAHPVASLQFWVQTGSCHEGKNLGSGLSHLLEHMVFKGTKSMSGQDLAQKVQELGGLWNAYTSNNRTVYYIEGPAKSWDEFLRILTELVFHPSFPEDEFEKEKEVIRREMAMYGDDPDAVAHKLLMETLYKKSPRKYPVLGELDSFNLLTREDVLEYHAGRYCANNVFVVIAGDVNAAAIIEKLDALTKELAPVEQSAAPLEREPRQWGKRIARKEFAVPYSKMSLAWRIPEPGHPDIPALVMLSKVLGAGRSARLYRVLHDELGLVHDVAVSANASPGEEGVFHISVDVDRDKRDRVKELILEELNQLAAADMSADIARGIKKAKAARIRSMSTVSGLADAIASQWFNYGNTDYYEEWLEAFESVSSCDLHRVIRDWLTIHNLTEASLDPEGSNAAREEAGGQAKEGELTTHTLANGLKLVLRRDHRVPTVYACIAFKAGMPYESEQTAGITSLLAECMLKGTASRDSENIAGTLENLGGYIDSTSGNNSLSLRFNVLSEDIGAGVELLADVVMNPSFPADAIEFERQTMISDAEERLEDPLATAFCQAKKQAYGNVSYGLESDGSLESLRSITIEQLKEHHARIVCAENAVIGIAGDFDETEIIALFERYFASLPQGSPPACAVTPKQGGGFTSQVLDKEQAVLVLAVPGVGVCSEKRSCAELFHTWCSDMAGPIFVGIREEAGLAYYASSYLFMGLDAGNMFFYLGTSMEQLNEAKAKLENILERLCGNGMTAEEFERTRASFLSGQMLSRQSNGTLSQRIALDTLYGLPADEFERQERLISQITLAEMNEFIKEMLSPGQPRVWSIVGNKAVEKL